MKRLPSHKTPLTCRDQIVLLARLFADAEGHKSLKRVSTLALNEGKKIDLIIGGADINTRTYENALQWFSDNWPEAARWPRLEVKRPDVSKAQSKGA